MRRTIFIFLFLGISLTTVVPHTVWTGTDYGIPTSTAADQFRMDRHVRPWARVNRQNARQTPQTENKQAEKLFVRTETRAQTVLRVLHTIDLAH